MQNEQAKNHVQEIRQNLFVSNKSQRDRQDRSIGILSNELYSSFGRVLLEILQNADDSNFDKDKLAEDFPRVYILLRWDCLVFHINERGMSRENIESVCDIGNSSKKNSHSRYFTGEKGIGYRSLFKITDSPGIYSGGYSIKFSSKPDEEIGLSYIVPRWEEEEDFPDVVKTLHSNICLFGTPWIQDDTLLGRVGRCDKDWKSLGTIHYIPFGRNMKQKFSAILSAIHDIFVHDILLFLRNIRSIMIDVEPRKESAFCSLGMNTLFPLLRRRLTSNDLVSVPDISQSLGEVFSLDRFKDDILSSIRSFRFVNIEVAQFDDDDLDSSKRKLLRENLMSSKYLIVDWEIPISEDQKLENAALRDRVTRYSTIWSIALPLLNSNLKLSAGKYEPIASSSSFSLGSSTFGRQKRLSGKLFCTFPLCNRICLPFHVNIQDLILTANREDIISDNSWNAAILDTIFRKQIPEFVAGLINPALTSSAKAHLINQRYSSFINDLLNSNSLPTLTLQGSNLNESFHPFVLRTSELIKISWLPPKPEDQNQQSHGHKLYSVCSHELIKRPVLPKIDGTFCNIYEISTNIQLNELCLGKNVANETLFCAFCNLHWNFIYMLNVHMRPVLHPTLIGGNMCMHLICMRPLQMLQALVGQMIASYNVRNVDVLEIFSAFCPLGLLNSISDEALVVLYGYLFATQSEVGVLGEFEGVARLPIIPTRGNGRVSMEMASSMSVYVSDELFDSYYMEHGLHKYSAIIRKVCQFEFFSDAVYGIIPSRMRSLIERAFKIEKMTPSVFFKMIAEQVDLLLERAWENAMDRDVHELLLKITPLAIEEASVLGNDNRFLIKLPVVVQTYSPSFLRALLYEKELPKSYASREELLNKDKLARCSSVVLSGWNCSWCRRDAREKLEMVDPTSVALRMSQVSKSLTSLMLLHSNWERSNMYGSSSSSGAVRSRVESGDGAGGHQSRTLGSSERAFEYKGLTIVPPLWPPLVEWVFPKVSDRFHFVEISSEYIVQDPPTSSCSGEDDSRGLAFRTFTNKFINLLEQWYVGCNFDRLPPKTDASPLSWMANRNTYPICSSCCFYCKHLVYVMRAGAIIQIANEYSRRSYNSSFLNEILSSYPWIPISLNNDNYFGYYMSQVNKEQLEDCCMADFSEGLLLSKPKELFVPKINKNLDGIVKHISQIVLNLLPVTLRNGYKNPKPRDNRDASSAHYTFNRTEEDIGNESKLISETLEELGVTTQVSSPSLIRVLRDYKKMMGLRDRDGASPQRNGKVEFRPHYNPDLSHIAELAVFGFGITRENLFASDWWPSLMDEWSSLKDGSQEQSLQATSDIDIISDIYCLLGRQMDFDLSADIKKAFYTESLLYIPLMKSTLYNWVPVDYNSMVWSDPYDFFHGAFIVLSKFINKSKLKCLRPFFLSLVSEQPVHHHYASLWLRECPNLLRDGSKEGKIKFESFVNISISKISVAFQNMSQTKRCPWLDEFLKSAKVPIKGMHKFLRREECCVEDFPIGSLKSEGFRIPLAISSSPNSQFFYTDVLKIKTLSECYRVTYKVRSGRDSGGCQRFASKGANRLWLTLEFWGTLMLLLKQRSLDVYLSIMRILEERSASDRGPSHHSATDCDFCVTESQVLDQISNSYDHKPLSVSDKLPSVGERAAHTIAYWLVMFVNAHEVEADDIELNFDLNISSHSLPRSSRKKIGVLYRQIPHKSAASILLVNKNVEKTSQLKDLYTLLLDPLKGSDGLSHMASVDLYELLILSSSQRLLLLSKNAPSSDYLSSGGEEKCFTLESVVKEGLDLLKKCSRSECLLDHCSSARSGRQLVSAGDDFLTELSNNGRGSHDVSSSASAGATGKTSKDSPETSLDSLIKEYMRQNPLSLATSPQEDEVAKAVGLWGEKASFEAIIPGAVSRKLALKSVEHSLIEDYVPKKLASSFVEDCTIDMDDCDDFAGLDDMSLEDSSKHKSQGGDALIRCKVKCFRESEATTIKLVWLNSLSESFLPCDFILLRESCSGEGLSDPRNYKQQVLALIEVKTTRLPVWQFNISGSELQLAKRAGSKYKLLLIKDAGSSESQWSLIDDVQRFIQEKCTLISGAFEASSCDLNTNTSGILGST